MTSEVGIYRGSFDPPHYGHLEAVNLALNSGMSSVTVIYKDTNPHKPFRCHDKLRKQLLKTLFANMPQIHITKKSYKAAMADLLADPSIEKIHQIIGSDILHTPVWPVKNPDKLAYFIHHRDDYPILTSLESWNSLPVTIAHNPTPGDKPYSSSEIRCQLFERDFQAASQSLPQPVFEQILSLNAFLPSDDEYRHRTLIQAVKKIIEKEFVSQKIVPIESFPLSFHLGSDLGMSGLSGDLITFIKDKHGQIIFAVKIFIGADFESNYESERIGYETLAKLELTLVKVPKLFFSYRMENYAFIGMSFVEGSSLADVMFHNDAAIDLCARANLELHVAQRIAPAAITHELISVYETFIDSIIDKLSAAPLSQFFSDSASRLALRRHFIRDAFIANPGLLSFTHGDPNHSNWIVDGNFQHVNYIDLSLFNRSISAEGTPRGFAINELEESLLTIRIAAKRIGNVPPDRILELQQLYKKSYLSNAPADITTFEAQQYFSFYWSLRVIDNIFDKWKGSESPELKLKYLNQLQNDLESLN